MNLEERKEQVECLVSMKEEIEANPKAWVTKNAQEIAEGMEKDAKEIVKNWKFYANLELDFLEMCMFSVTNNNQ